MVEDSELQKPQNDTNNTENPLPGIFLSNLLTTLYILLTILLLALHYNC